MQKKRLTIKDIQILSEGQQVKRAIVETFGSIDEFIKKNKINISKSSLNSYINSKTIKSPQFKIDLIYAFNMEYEEIALTENRQIERYVDLVFNNIRIYNNAEDFNTFDRLLGMCTDLLLIAKMNWCYGCLHFRLRNKFEANKYFGLAMYQLGSNNDELYVRFNIDQALLYFNEADYSTARLCLAKAKEQLSENCSNETLFLYNYRSGLVNNNTNQFELAKKDFIQSIKYAELTKNDTYIRYSYMNVGLAHKKAGEYDDGVKYYNKALELCDNSDSLLYDSTEKDKSVIYNNLADLYKTMGKYDEAYKYILLSLQNIDSYNISDKIATTNTYTELKLIMGVDHDLSDLVNLYKSQEIEKDYASCRRFILEGINIMINCGVQYNDELLLTDLKLMLERIISNTDLPEYKKELKSFVYDINQFLSEEG